MLTIRDLNKNKTVPANFDLLCEGQKGHNIGQKGHNTGQKGLLRVKRDKTRPFRTKGQKRHLFSSVFFPERAWNLAWNSRVWLYQEALEKQPITSTIVKQPQIRFLSGSLCMESSLCMETMKGRTRRTELSNPACSISGF